MIFRESLDPTSLDWTNFIVAVDEAKGDDIIGIAQVKPYADCREFGSLAVKPAYRAQGIGARLVRFLIDRESGDVYLLCRDTRATYYTRFGFGVIDPKSVPRTLQKKMRVARLFEVFGVRVVAMKLRR